MMRCEACWGTGDAVASRDYYEGEEYRSFHEDTPCPKCGGTGKDRRMAAIKKIVTLAFSHDMPTEAMLALPAEDHRYQGKRLGDMTAEELAVVECELLDLY